MPYLPISQRPQLPKYTIGLELPGSAAFSSRWFSSNPSRTAHSLTPLLSRSLTHLLPNAVVSNFQSGLGSRCDLLSEGV